MDNSESRKKDHIELAFQSQQKLESIDQRFYYEPLFHSHINNEAVLQCQFAGFDLQLPLWVSSMTGGTEKAKYINKTLAQACGKYGMGMGLGSCRSLLDSDKHFDDFDVKQYLGDYPLFANLGIAQVEEIALSSNWQSVKNLIKNLSVDGLIIHVNPMQEWMQPEGDKYTISPLETIKYALDALDTPIIVKEVGQGFGPKSLYALADLPIAAIEFGASGGTNFSLLELLRSNDFRQKELSQLTHIGHTAEEMVGFVNNITNKQLNLIISGGVKDILDGYYLKKICQHNAIIGQASKYLTYALESFESLCQYIELQKDTLLLAESYLVPKNNSIENGK